MKKIFLVAGEVSGDRIAGWYLAKRLAVDAACVVEGIGGDCAQAAGMQLYEGFNGLNLVGVVELIRHAPRLLKKIQQVADHILSNCFEEVILVDFPGFNLRLAKILKTQKPTLTITYVSPPQLWVWGAWRIKALVARTDAIIVMYPFEVAWYAARGVHVVWLGSPVAEEMAKQRQKIQQQELVALLPASRSSELKHLFPLFLAVVQKLKAIRPQCRFILPVPQSLRVEQYRAVAQQHGMQAVCAEIIFITDEQKKYTILQTACVALTKPGTVTLELALLQLPMIIMFKASWLSYLLARLVVRVKFMGLPNLLAQVPLCPELIQRDCTVDRMVQEVDKIIAAYQGNSPQYQAILQKYADFAKTFGL